MPIRLVCFILAIAIVVPNAGACLWDRDTVRDEQQGLPGMKELLAGKFERHSKFYYQTRVARLVPLIQKEPMNLAAYDDLAVAYEKLEDRENAIAVMLAKEKVKPGEYTTNANLGTFYLHKGDLESGIRSLRRALQINPDAHFGREEYQVQLAEFLLAGKSDPNLLKSDNFLHKDFDAILGPNFRFRGYTEGDPLDKLGLKPNVFDGITGMLRFGTGKSAELWYVLGELLAARGERHVAYAAYRRAIENGHPRADFIRENCMKTVKRRNERTDTWDDDLITRERAEGDQWVTAYQDFENDLIRAGKDPDDQSNLAPFYASTGSRELKIPAANLSEKMLDTVGIGPRSTQMEIIKFLSGVFIVCMLGIYGFWRLARARKRRRLKKA